MENERVLQKQTKEHLVWVDVLRTLAIFAVLVQHAASYYFEGGYGEATIVHILNNVSRFHVPSFLMITGTLLLGREISIKDIWTKYMKRIAIAFFAWSILYTGYNTYFRVGHMGVTEILKCAIGDIAAGGTRVLWYPVMLAGLYAVVPVLSTWLKNASMREQRYALVVLLMVTSVLPTLVMIDPVNTVIGLDLQRISMVFPGVLMFYFIAGYVLVKTPGLKDSNKLKFLAVTIVVISVVIVVVYSVCAKKSADLSFLPIVSLTLGVFCLAYNRGGYGNLFKAVVNKTAECAFGVYLVHRFVQYGMQFSGVEAVLFSLQPGIGVILYSIVVFLISWAIVAVLRMSRVGRIIT